MSTESKYEFKAEIKKLLQILSKSLYQHKEVFLRELISNSSDALKKMHFISLSNKDIENPELPFEINVTVNSKEKTLTISDTGLGMSKEEMIESLGTIAHSGTEKFIKAVKEAQDKNSKELDMDIIGQFGVGFYSVFMVAEKVRVISKSYKKNEPAMLWESDGSGEFVISPTERATRGTDVIVYIKEDENEYLTQYRIESIIKKYSNFVPYPIYVTEIKDEDKKKKEVDMGDEGETKTEEAKTSDQSTESSAKSEVKDAEVKKDETQTEIKAEDKPKEPEIVKPEPPPAKKSVNEIIPLWKRDSKEIKDDEYVNFYHYISNRYDNFLDKINYKTDGQVQFHSILFIPESKSKDIMRPDTEYGLGLYSKNIMIMQKAKELIPPWMRFLEGVVDSEDIPLNISRDTIQNNRIVMKIKDLLVKKFLGDLELMAQKEADKYKKFWKEFNFFIKEGIVTDFALREKLLKYLRFSTNKTKDDELRSLDDYIKNMKTDQKEIYYLIGENLSTLRISPHLGFYEKNGFEVLFLTEPIDNFLMMNIHEYKVTTEGEKPEEKSYPFKAIDITEHKKAEESKDEKKDEKDKDKSEEKKKEELPPATQRFLDFTKATLGDKIIDVQISDKLYDNACRLANPTQGMSSSMQRAMRYWSQSTTGKSFEIPKKILEINPEHPIIKGLIDLYETDPANGKIKPVITQLYENCLLAEGDLPDPSLMVPRLNQLIEMLITGKTNVKNLAEKEIKEEKTESPKNEESAKKEDSPKSTESSEKHE